jgi:hypothetical protein
MWHVLFVTQEKSFDLGSVDPRGSPTAIKLWLEICQLKHIFKTLDYAELNPYIFYKIHMFPPQRTSSLPRLKLFS